MATSTKSASATRNPPSQYGNFVQIVVQRTGLDSQVVLAWLLSEKGPSGNPLNIGPGRNYGSPNAAANATATLLLTSPAYSHIITAARSGNVKAQITAIASSPWDKCRYRGTNKDGTCAAHPPGTLLFGLYHDLSGVYAQEGSTKTTTLPNGLEVTQHNIPDTPAGDALHNLFSSAEGKFTIGLSYATLTALALALGVIGIARLTGTHPAQLAALRGGGGAGAAAGLGEIPF